MRVGGGTRGPVESTAAFTVMVAGCMLVAGCGNSAYGPRRIAQAGYLDNGSARSAVPATFSCQQPSAQSRAGSSPATATDANGVNLLYDFNRLACDSVNARTDAAAATAMMDSGFTLVRLRCNDFFAERAGHQTQARFWRKTIAPVSAVIAGVIGLVNFKDAERADAIQILGIAQAVTVAGFEIYEQEFLFDSENVNAVRRLVMRALDAHSAAALAGPVTGFNHGVRHLMDNQMICTPANILELVRTSIAEGEVRVSEGVPVRARLSSAADELELLSRARTARALGLASLTDDQLGGLWWLSQGGQSPEELAVIADRLGPSIAPGAAAGGALSLSMAAQAPVAQLMSDLTPTTVKGIRGTVAEIKAAIANRGAAPAVEATRSIRFSTGPIAPGRSLDVSGAPGG